MVHFVEGNLLDSNVDFICHQVNCQGAMRSGIAKAIRDKWPKVYNEYMDWYKDWERRADDLGASYEDGGPTGSELMLGQTQFVEIENNQVVVNMAAQQHYGYDGRRYTSYDAFWSCLGAIKDYVPHGFSIGFPDHIGSLRGGANWNVIKTMIEEVLGSDYEVYIYKLEV